LQVWLYLHLHWDRPENLRGTLETEVQTVWSHWMEGCPRRQALSAWLSVVRIMKEVNMHQLAVGPF
jgi:hypothetical protein